MTIHDCRTVARGARAFFTAGALLACAAAGAQPAPPPAPSPAPASDAPFWARPRSAPAQGQGPECVPEAPATPPPAAVRLDVLIAGGAALLLMLFVWRWARPARPPPAPVSAPPPPARRGPAITATDAGLSDLDLARARIELGEASAAETDTHAFYRDVAQSLAASVEQNPERPDLQRKLLEVYYSAGMADEFAALATAYLEKSGGMQDPEWREIAEMGYRLLPNHELFRAAAQPQGAGARPLARRMHFRRFYDRRIHQGALHAAQQQLAQEFERARADPQFLARLGKGLAEGLGRPTPLARAADLGLPAEGARVLVKREDRARRRDEVLANALAQVLLARQLGRRTVVTATRDGTHGLAVATVAARLGRQCIVFIPESDLRAHYARVLAIRKLGAQVRPVYLSQESRYDDPRQHALEAWVAQPDERLYVSSLTGGPHPFPIIAGEGQAMVGREAAEQLAAEGGRAPAAVVACAADGYAGIGLLRGFLDREPVQLCCVDGPEPGAADEDDEVDAPPAFRFLREHRYLRDTGRVAYVEGRDAEAMRVIEQCHAAGQALLTPSARSLAHALALARGLPTEETVLVLLTRQDEAPAWTQYQDL